VIRILRLTEPLGVEQIDAVRLVNILEWAERVARIWRNLGGIGVREFAECDQDGFGTLTPPPHLLRQISESNPPSSVSSNGDSAVSSITAFFSSGKFHLLKKSGHHHTERKLPPPDPSQRPFDAIINYLPSSMSDKALLKQSILVTTISRPFLVAANPSSYPRPRGIRRNFLSMRKPIYMMPPTPPLGSADSLNILVTGSSFSHGPPIKAHLVHLLPYRPPSSASNRVLESIEAFLLSFSFPPLLEAKIEDRLEPARTYLLDSAAFTENVSVPPSLGVGIDWTVADVLLSGCLNDESTPRVWLSGAADIVVSTQPPLLPSLTASTVARARLETHPLSFTPSSPQISTPLSYLGVNTPPTPPDSEVDTSEKRPLHWKFWKRRILTPNPY
jgi:hypothetical protein